MIRSIVILALLLYGATVSAQPAAPAMADAMRQDGKIYVVIAVIAVIFVCLAFFLIYLERKISRLERKVRNNSESTQSR